jgi:sterol carrier protein 2
VGLGGAVVITLYRRPDNSEAPSPETSKRQQDKVIDGRKWAGYNPAVEARWITDEELGRVKSRGKASLKMLGDGRKRYVIEGKEARL